MINEPNSNSRHDQTNHDLEKSTTTPETTETSKPTEKQSQTKQQRNYSQYVMRPLKAFGRGTIDVVNWLDAKGGFVTAVATVVIAVLTGVYVHYSHGQWKVMSGQLTEMQSANKTSAEDFTKTLTQMQLQTNALSGIATAAGSMTNITHQPTKIGPSIEIGEMGISKFNIGEDHPRQDVPLGEIAANVPLTANAVIKNFGQMPVWLDDVGIKLEVRSSPVQSDFQYSTASHREQMRIFSGEEFQTQNTDDITVSAEDFEGIKLPKLGGKRLVFHGIIGYHDSNKEHTTKFCFVWTGVDRFMSNCLEHNGAD